MMFELLAKNTTAQVIAKLISVFTAIVLIRLTTENLGKEGYGVYSFVMALVLLFGTLADWGTSIIAVRESSQSRQRQREIFGTAFVLRFMLSLVAVIFLNVASRVYPPWYEFVAPLTVGSLVLLFLSIKSSMSVVFQTFLKFEWLGLAEIINSLVFFLLAALFLVGGRGVVEVLFAWIIGTAMAALVSFLLALRITKINFSVSHAILGRLIKESLPMGMFLIFFSIYNRVDIIILQHFKGIGEVAVYNLAYKIHDNLVLGAAFLMASAFPVISRMYASPDAKIMLMGFYRKLFVILAVGGLLVAFVFYAAAPIVIQLLTGREFLQFTDSVMALRILVFATFISYLNHLTGYSLIAFGRQKIILFVGGVALLFNIVANMLFIPLYSWTAAAYITVATELIVFSLTFTFISVKIFKVYAHD